jgi:hypothetical protein
MTRTMTANIPGARLRDVERRLAMLRGAEAIDSFLAEHPNEVKILEQMVEQRRAGKPVPSLTRVQRVMLWSDGDIEYKMETAPEGAERPGERGGRGERGGGARSGPRGGGGAGGRERAGAASGPGGASVGRPAGGRPSGGRPGGAGGGRGPGGPMGQGRGPRPGGRPGGRGRSFEERGDRGMPRSGEGWVLLREGEKPPEPEPLPEYDWDEEETPTAQESEAPAADATGAEAKPD